MADTTGRLRRAGVDVALLGREQGESLTLMVPAANAFGVRDKSALYDMLMAHFITNAGMRPIVGSQIRGSNPDARHSLRSSSRSPTTTRAATLTTRSQALM